jgi:Zn-dependent protease with chaperone function
VTAPRSFLVRADEISPGWLLLYAATVAIAFACAWLRALILLIIGSLVLWIAGWPQLPGLVYLAVALVPLVVSLATIVVPAGGLWWQAASGGRRPSEREQHLYEQALLELREVDPQLRAPRLWFVIDHPDINAYAYADTLAVNRGLLETGALTPVLAHELGHLNSADARLAAALTRLTTPPRQHRRGILGTIIFIAGGSFALWLTGVPWAN